MDSNNMIPRRMGYIDNIRSLMIIFVVMMHAAVTYSGLGMWYYNEGGQLDFFTMVFFAFFQTHLQAFFMSLLFLIAGYFAAKSLERKGPAQFIKGRFIRLGIPTLFYILFIHVLNLKMIHPDLDVVGLYERGIKSLSIFSWTGPMWFAGALLVFSILCGVVKWITGTLPAMNVKISWKSLFVLILITTSLAFLLRLFFPIGSSVLNFQFGFFAAYTVFFILGFVSFREPFFEAMDMQLSKRLLLVSFIGGLPLWLFILALVGQGEGIHLINGGWRWPAMAYGFWESFFCITLSFGLLGLFRHKYDHQGRVRKFLSDNAFGAYVFHPPILIGISLIFKPAVFFPVLKFLLISSMAVPASFVIPALIRKIPFLKKIFS